MSKADIWMPLYIGDYLADTTRLNTEQHGAYLLLIMDYWRNGPPPDNDVILAQITRMSPDAWSIAKSIVLAFFEHVDGFLIHTRIEHEKASSISRKNIATAKAAAAAARRWGKDGKNAPSNAPSNEQALHEECPSPSPSPSQESKPISLAEKPPKRKRKTQFSDSFVPNEKHYQAANSHGLNIHVELEKFKNHHVANGSLFANWDAAFSKWIGNAVEFRRSSPSKHEKFDPVAFVNQGRKQGGGNDEFIDGTAERVA